MDPHKMPPREVVCFISVSDIEMARCSPFFATDTFQVGCEICECLGSRVAVSKKLWAPKMDGLFHGKPC